MEKNNNLETVINEAQQEVKEKWSKIIPSLRGKQAKRHLLLLALLEIYGPQTTWDLAKLYLEKIEHKVKDKNDKTFFYYRMKENSIIYKRLRFLESKRYVTKEGSLYQTTFKALFLLFLVNPRFITILPFKGEKKITCQSENAAFLADLYTLNVPQSSQIVEAAKSVFSNHMAAKIISEAFRHFVWSLKINIDEIDDDQLVSILISQIRKTMKQSKNEGKHVEINLPET